MIGGGSLALSSDSQEEPRRAVSSDGGVQVHASSPQRRGEEGGGGEGRGQGRDEAPPAPGGSADPDPALLDAVVKPCAVGITQTNPR